MTEKENSTPAKPPAKKKKPAPAEMTHVRLVSVVEASALVEFRSGDLWQRVYIPLDKFDYKSSRVDAKILAAGIPYGTNWAEAVVEIDGRLLDEELKRRGIWTLSDMRQYPEHANAAINLVSGIVRRNLEKFAGAQEVKENGN